MSDIQIDFRFGYLAEVCADIYHTIYEYVFVCGVCKKSLKNEYIYVYFNKCKCPCMYLCDECWHNKWKPQCGICDTWFGDECAIINSYIYAKKMARRQTLLANAYKKCINSHMEIKISLPQSIPRKIRIICSDYNTIHEIKLFLCSTNQAYEGCRLELNGIEIHNQKCVCDYDLSKKYKIVAFLGDYNKLHLLSM